MMIPHVHPVSWPDIAPTKFASSIELADPSECAIALIGMPDDTGVGLNNGRPGAAEGPTAFRDALAKSGVAAPGGFDWPRVFDAGDVVPAGDNLHETHDRVTEAVSALLDLGLFPVGIGGGHDLTYPFVRAVTNKSGPMHGVYFDPHLDVRDSDGSGMPFRRLLETGAAESLTIHGFSAFANSREHRDWFIAQNGEIGKESPSDPWPNRDTFVSLDLDVIDAAHAPGVSAMNPCGWSPAIASAWVHAAGRNPRVRCFDIMELSPPNDDRGRTARLAAHLFLTFLRAFTERPS